MALADKEIRRSYTNAAFWLCGTLGGLGGKSPLREFASDVDQAKSYLKDLDEIASLYETDKEVMEKISSLFGLLDSIQQAQSLYELSGLVAKAYSMAEYLNVNFQSSITHREDNRLRSQEELNSGF